MAHAQVLNGSFEIAFAAPDGSGFVEIAAGSGLIQDWQITSGSVDLIGMAWDSQEGIYSIDLNGCEEGTLTQSVTTSPGSSYCLQFYLSANPNMSSACGSPDIREVEVIAGSTVETYSIDASLLDGQIDWLPQSVNFVATGVTADVKFTSLSGGCCGPAIDNISVVAAGCTNDTACNYNPTAICNDGSCVFASGCDTCDSNGEVIDNPEPGESCNDGDANTINDIVQTDCLCAGEPAVQGCIDYTACNFDPFANVDDESCLFATGCDICDGNGGLIDNPEIGDFCDDGNSCTQYDTVQSDCSCTGELQSEGCTDLEACNFNPDAFCGDDSCVFVGDPCPDPDESGIVVNGCACLNFVLFVPNAFTPNNDRVNDVLGAVGPIEFIETFKFQIFNRWNEVVFETYNAYNFWNGSMNGSGHYAPDGVYVWKISVKWPSNPIEELAGHVSLTR